MNPKRTLFPIAVILALMATGCAHYPHGSHRGDQYKKHRTHSEHADRYAETGHPSAHASGKVASHPDVRGHEVVSTGHARYESGRVATPVVSSRSGSWRIGRVVEQPVIRHHNEVEPPLRGHHSKGHTSSSYSHTGTPSYLQGHTAVQGREVTRTTVYADPGYLYGSSGPSPVVEEPSYYAQQQYVQMRQAVRPDESLPLDARPGECFARVFVPPMYDTISEQVLVKDGYEKVEVVPATYRTVAQQVMVQGPSERIVQVIPERYEHVSEEVLVRDASERIEVVPAEYRTVTEQVLVEPGYTEWKPGRGSFERIDEATGEIMCLVEVPPKYRTVTRRELVSAPGTQRIPIPAQYRTVQRRVKVADSQVITEPVPAQFKTIHVQELVSEPYEQYVSVPAEYRTVTRRVPRTEGGMEWVSVICETNATSANVMQIQRALRDQGYYHGAIDGHIGGQLLSAARAFQQSRGIATGGLTYETVTALGVAFM